VEDSTDIAAIRSEAAAILASGVLGRSRFYSSLLEYLVECAGNGYAPKEVEVASEVFNRGADFDPSQDSMVRVYAHNLRQKLRQYYKEADSAQQLTIPKGEYRLILIDRDAEEEQIRNEARRARRIEWSRSAAVAALILVGFLAGVLVDRLSRSGPSALEAAYDEVAASPLWSAVLDDDLPIVVVVGDYYIFGEVDARGDVDRMIREFSINSSRDLDELLMLEPDYVGRYIDLDLTYLPSSTAFAMREFLRVIHTTDKQVRVASMSHLDANDIKSSHIIYVGYISALDKLIDFVFAPSELGIGRTFDELVNTITGQSFVSEAGMPTERRNYRDYGLFSTFPGANGNQFVIIAGTRDEGMMQSAQAVSDPSYFASSLAALETELDPRAPAFEILYEVAGFDRTNLNATIVHAAALHMDD
jgi:hypothetical protein